MRYVATVVLITAAIVTASAQDKPAFDVVSIRRNTAAPLGSNVTQRPDGGFTMLNIPLGTLLSGAYAPAVPADMGGLPDWVMRERYDVGATSSLSCPSMQDEQTAMRRSMLAERLKLAAHVETREQPEASTTMEALVQLLRPATGRLVVDKTGLSGSYQVSLTFDRMAGLRGPDTAASSEAAPSVFTAVQEQLGLKLEPSRASRETLIIDHIERPGEN
jgi:Protein of unknown function (DUF3738)